MTELRRDDARKDSLSATEVAPVTDKIIFWIAVSLIVALTVIRLSETLLERITVNERVHELAAELGEPALADLAVRVGVTLAAVISAAFQIVYLSLCAAVDEKLLPRLMASTRSRSDRRGRRPSFGPAMLTGIAATLPVQLVALVLGLSSPKNSPLVYVWLLILVTVMAMWACTRPPVRASGARKQILVSVFIGLVAALSLLL